MTSTTATADLSAMYEAWSAPYTGDPGDVRASARRRADTILLAAEILTADLATKVGPMTIVQAGWSKETADAAEAFPPGSPEWYATLGAHEHVTLTSDGRFANRQQWCECPAIEDWPAWVRYESWTADGCDRHGFVCGSCRRLVQSG